MEKFNNEEYLKFLNEWKTERKYEPFCEDGILDVEKWEKSSRIMFLLKETYLDSGFYKIHNCGPCGPDNKRFWENMRMYTYILDEFSQGKQPILEEALKIRFEPNDSVAYVNIKKNVQNNKESNNSDISEFARQDKLYLLRQIELISPKIIFCSGTFGNINIIFDNVTSISHNLSKANGILLLGYYHLSDYGIGFEEEFHDVVKIVGDYYKE